MLRISQSRVGRRHGADDSRICGGCFSWVPVALVVALLLAPTPSLATDPCSRDSITAAERTYDLPAARSVLEACVVEASENGGEAAGDSLVRAALLVAELDRIDFEEVAPSQKKQRRRLGASIDAAADLGLKALEPLPETSCRQRLRADLLATKIRSDFRAKKYADEMKAAAKRALELDPGNASAMVTLAKPLIFANDRHGRDLDEAIEVLSGALEIDPTLESALLLRALAFENQGETEACRSDLKAALAANPSCRLATERLLATAPPEASSQPD